MEHLSTPLGRVLARIAAMEAVRMARTKATATDRLREGRPYGCGRRPGERP